MLSLALTFLIVGLVAGLLGLYGVAAVASQIAWVLFLGGRGVARAARGPHVGCHPQFEDGRHRP